MRAVVQRVSSAEVMVDGDRTGAIGVGLVVLAGIAENDTIADANALADKIAGLRIFPDEGRKMNRSVVDVGGAVLLVSQFTLLANVRKGRRPSFTEAAPAAEAEILMAKLAGAIRSYEVTVERGRFGAMMDVSLTNDGPVTIVIDTVDGTVV